MASWRGIKGLGAQKLTKSLRNSFYAALVCGNVLVTVLEARLTRSRVETGDIRTCRLSRLLPSG